MNLRPDNPLPRHEASDSGKQGVTLLADYSNFESDDRIARLRRLIDDAGDIGCEAALRKHEHNVDYLIDEKRAKYLDVVAVAGHEDVLEIGASMGQHSRLIARRCRSLEAIEVVAAQAEFADLWCRQSGATNARFSAGGGSGKLPYQDNAFDVVIMNYVLEWCAGRDSDNADAFHLRFLKEVRRVLKPAGRFFVSTKNRYGLRLLFGGVDEHLGIPFGNALPRPLARVLSKRVAREIPRGHLHSRAALEKLLRAAGFSVIEPYLSFPDARRPDFIELFDGRLPEKLRAVDRSKYSRKDRLFLALPALLQRHVATSHSFVAR